jgi:uncharacterized OB-fold protein
MEYPLTYEDFKKGLSQGELLGLECRQCGKLIVPPSAFCVDCGHKKLTKYSFITRGVIRTFTVIRVPPQGFTAPFVVALVELEEGPWIMGNLIDINTEEASLDLIGKKVKVASQKVPADPYSGGDRIALTFKLEAS